MNETVEYRARSIRRAAAMGVVAGLRSQVPFFVLGRAAANGDFAKDANPPLGWLRAPKAQTLLGFSAAGEMVVDKLPIVPNRTDPGPLFGRLVVGAAAGTAIALDAGAPIVKGVLAGGCGALIGSFAGQHGRAWISRGLGLPGIVVALIEDGLALELGRRIARHGSIEAPNTDGTVTAGLA